MEVDLTKLRARLLPYFLEESYNKINEYYCSPEDKYEWLTDSNIREPKIPNKFESDIKEFLLNNKKHPNSDCLRVIIGGIGTGKSTTINKIFNEILNNPIICERSASDDKICKHKPQLLNLNFNAYSESDVDAPFYREMENILWSKVAANIKTSNYINFDKNAKDTIKFMKWCFTQNKLLANSIKFHQYLDSNERKIEAYLTNKAINGIADENLLESIVSTLETFTATMEPKDFCWFLVYKYKYQLNLDRSKDCRCIYILLDDVDHLHPELQKSAVAFAVNLTEILNAKTIITIRPLTWERSSNGHLLIDTMYQVSPSLKNVIKKRIEWFLKDQRVSPFERKTIISLMKNFLGSGENPHRISNLITSTSGVSIRFALRNFINIFESPLLSKIQVELDDRDPISKNLQIWELARSFFFLKDNSEETIDKLNFENLYYVGNLFKPLLKPRILDYVIRLQNKQAELNKLLNFIEVFGYDRSMIFKALNELFLRSRPLLWCNTTYKLDEEEYSISNAKIMATPIGIGYLNNLFGECHYDEQFIAKSYNEFVDIRKIYLFHKELTAEDLKDIRQYCNTYGGNNYRQNYPKIEFSALCISHWNNLLIGIKRLAHHAKEFEYDPERLEWLNRQVDEILNEPN